MQKKIVKVGLLSHYFTDNNLGCVALSICNVRLIDEAARKNHINIEYLIYVNEKQPHWELDFTENPYEYRVFSSSKQTVKHPVKFIKTDIFRDCDIVFNLCAGDGFTDIYGFGRVLSETYMTMLAKLKGADVVLAPQTIGPFRSAVTRAIARKALNCCEYVFSRDSTSADYCRSLGYRGETEEVIDVAFALPFCKREFGSDCINVGLNVSGLLYEGGYNRNNYFGLSFNYRDYIESLLAKLEELDVRVHLISHVVTSDGSIEDDYVACKKLHEEYPNSVLMPRSESPIEVKSYIAGMDVFIGARMHSTIGAFSAGVPVIPVAYSRKFNGLFDTLKYKYYIDAKSGLDLEDAVRKTLDLVSRRDELKEQITRSSKIYHDRLAQYCDSVARLLSRYCE